MSGRWFYIDGKLAEVSGHEEDVKQTIRNMVKQGHTIKAARAPQPVGPRGYATASAHVKR